MMKWQRVMMVLVSVVLSVSWAWHTAHAAVEERLLELARRTLDLEPHWLRGAPRVLKLNGATLRIESGVAEAPLSLVLERAHAGCVRADAGVRALIAGLPAESASAVGLDGLALRVDGADVGVVACLGLDTAGALSLSDLTNRVAAFARELDVAELGGVRLLFARTVPAGTLLVTVASEGPLPLARMFPARGDAPGLDLPDIGKPRSTTREISVVSESAGSAGIAVYRVADGTRALRELDQQLRSRGFQGQDAHSDTLRYYKREGRSVIVQQQGDQLALLGL